MAAELGIQHFLLFAHRVVPVLLAPLAGRLQSSPEPFGYRLHMHCELALAAACANMREAEEIEGSPNTDAEFESGFRGVPSGFAKSDPSRHGDQSRTAREKPAAAHGALQDL